MALYQVVFGVTKFRKTHTVAEELIKTYALEMDTTIVV